MLMESLRVFIALCLTIPSYEGTTCLYGVNLPFPTDTDQVIQCSEHQSCYLDVAVTIDGKVRYNVGCRGNHLCYGTSNPNDEIINDEIQTNMYNKRVGEVIACSQCCNGTLCNSKGCNYQGYQTPRGPICMSCDDQLTPTDCNTITQCGRDQVCNLRTILNPATHQKRFQTRCELAEQCERDVIRYIEIKNIYFGRKRQTNKLFTEQDVACEISCCSGDLCNGNCTALSSNI